MNIPGFTAEASLHVTDGRYRLVSNNYAPEAVEQIFPQARRLSRVDCNDDGFCCAIWIGDFGIATISCFQSARV
jgi:hypothetical protein